MEIILDKKTTLQLLYQSSKDNIFDDRFSFKTKYPWKCLSCLNDIYISYRQFSVIAIYCDNCKNEAQKDTKNSKIIQAQYMRIVKENQLKLIEEFMNKQR